MIKKYIFLTSALFLFGCKGREQINYRRDLKYKVEVNGEVYNCYLYKVEELKTETLSAVGLISTYEKNEENKYRVKLFDGESLFRVGNIILDTTCTDYKVEKIY